MQEDMQEKLFHTEEFKLLKDEIKTKQIDISATQRQVLLAVAVLYGVAATLGRQQIDENLKELAWAIWWVPSILILFAFLDTLIHYAVIGEISKYIRNNIEAKLAFNGRGWEASYGDPTSEKPLTLRYNLHLWFWGLLLAATIAVAWYVTFFAPTASAGA